MLDHQVVMTVLAVFFFNDTATTEIYTLSLHDALPIWSSSSSFTRAAASLTISKVTPGVGSRSIRSSSACSWSDRKSTRLNSSHANISYAVFCLKKKNPLYIQLLPCFIISVYSFLTHAL